MATQEQVNGLQAQLLAGEAAYKTAMQDCLDAANADPGVTAKNLKLARLMFLATKQAMSAAHEALALCANDGGVEPLSGGQDKD